MKPFFDQKNFFNEIEPLISKSMGTEHMSPFLYNFIKFVRPHRCLEIGGGLTTVYILAALKELYELEKLEVAKKLELEKHLKFYNEDYKNLVNTIPKEELDFDLIWCDLGGLEHYLVYQDLLLPMISNRGGYIIFHSTLSNVHGLAFLSQLKLKLNNGMLPNFELISLLEPQKRRQNSCTILRKIGGLSNRIYSERP